MQPLSKIRRFVFLTAIAPFVPWLLSGADLSPTELAAPPSASTQTAVELSWTVINTGKDTAIGTWNDRVYFSRDDKLGNDDYLGQTSWTTPVAAGAKYSSSLKFGVPNVTPGQYFLILVLDYYNNLPETDEANNTAVRTIRILVPDLAAKGMSAPGIVDAGQGIEITWDGLNLGDADALPSWYDRVHLSTDTKYDTGDRFLGQTQWTQVVAVASGYTSKLQCSIPNVPAGQYFLLLDMDRYNNVYEVTETNNYWVRPIQIRVPDLAAKGMSAPGIVDAGQGIEITWDGLNLGDTVALPSWYDRVYLSTDTKYDTGDRFLGQTQWTQVVAVASGYTSKLQCSIPNVPAGQYFLLLEIDHYNNVYEVTETNNYWVRPIQIRVPDLAAKGMSAPGIVDAGQSIEITWDGLNLGDADALPSWYDRVYLSTDTKYDTGDRYLGQTQWTQAVAVASGYTSKLQCSIPNVPPGQYFLLLDMDRYNNVYEVTEANNYWVRPIQIRVPDLAAKGMSAPGIVDAGQGIEITWDGLNLGDADALPSWYDRVHLSTDTKFDTGDRFLGQTQGTQVVAVASGYTSKLQCSIPNVPPGQYFLLLEIDHYNNVYEVTETNNYWVRPIQVRVPDLAAVKITGPLSAEAREAVEITWEGANIGDTVALPNWTDRLYFSSDEKYSTDDQFLGQLTHTEPLAAGTNYITALHCSIPNLTNGLYYLLLNLDWYGDVYEVAATNNLLVRAIRIGPEPPPPIVISRTKTGVPKEVQFNAPSGTKRVEYRVNGRLIGTAYAPAFNLVMTDAVLGTMVVQGTNQIVATAFAEDGSTLFAGTSMAASFLEGMPTTTEVLEPFNGEEFFRSDGAGGQVDLWLRVRASKTLMAPPGEPPGERHYPVQKVLFKIDGELVHTSTNGTPEDPLIHEYHYSSTSLARGRHRFYAAVDPPDGFRMSSDAVRFYVTNTYPVMSISRTVTPHGNWFGVTLEIRNTGGGAAELDFLEEVITGFQACDVRCSWDPTENQIGFDLSEQQSRIQVTFPDHLRLLSNAVCTVEYDAVPILFRTDTAYGFGGGGRLEYRGVSGPAYTNAPLPTTTMATTSRGRRALSDAVAAALRQSDYLLVTSPSGLETSFTPEGACQVLTNMAELAIVRNGVLGYFHGVGRMHTDYRPGDFLTVSRMFRPSYERDQVIVARVDDNTVHCYTETEELSLDIDCQLPLCLDEIGTGYDLQAQDGFAVGHLAEWEESAGLADVIVAKSDGSGFYAYIYIPETGTFGREVRDVEDAFAAGDGLLVAQVLEETYDTQLEDVVVVKSTGEIHAWTYPMMHDTPQNLGRTAFRTGDLLAAGKIYGNWHDQIVVGSLADNQVNIYSRSETRADFVRRASIDLPLDAGDALAMGDVWGDAAEELVVVDASTDMVHVYARSGAAFAIEEVTSFEMEYAANDRLAVGYVGSRDKANILHVYGSSAPGRPQGSVDVIHLGGGEAPGDRFELDELLNEGGGWASQLATNWATDGFLLLVGEESVVPTFSASWDLFLSEDGAVDYTDRNYASTTGDGNYPELSIGRIPGSSAECLSRALRTAIEVVGNPDLLRNDSAYCASGHPRGPEGTSDNIDGRPTRRAIASTLSTLGFTDVMQEHEPCDTNLLSNAADRDVVFLVGHGWAGGWDVLTARRVRDLYAPGSTRPLVYAKSCLTGRYPEGWSLAERFLGAGASAYVGATEITIGGSSWGWSRRFAEAFFARIHRDRPLGTTMKLAKRYRLGANTWAWDDEFNAYHCAVNHFYGDPKLELTWRRGAVALGDEPVYSPAPELEVSVPMYAVTSVDGEDMAEIPGEEGEVAVMGRPIVPLYTAKMLFPPGCQVQGVSLKRRSQPVYGKGLHLPIASPLRAGGGSGAGPETDPGWWPDQAYSWWTQENQDGSTMLRILAYALQVTNATQARFFTNYLFGIDYTTSRVEIVRLNTDRSVYPTGAVVRADLYLRNTSQTPTDVTLAAWVRSNLGHRTNQLAAPKLTQLNGAGWTRLEWDSSSQPGGMYRLEVVARDAQGQLLDDAATEFEIGRAEGKIAAFELKPRDYQLGDNVDMSATFANTGSKVLSGTIIIALQDALGAPVVEFRREFAGLMPGSFARFETTWTNVTLAPRNCRALVYAQYGGQTTALLVGADGLEMPLRWDYASAANGTVALRWYSVAGRHYTVLSTPDLNQAFTPLATGLPATPPLNVYEHTPKEPAAFYRLVEY